MAHRDPAPPVHAPNYVWDAVNQRVALGRFGWKSNQPSVKQQIAAAYLGDLGWTGETD